MSTSNRFARRLSSRPPCVWLLLLLSLFVSGASSLAVTPPASTSHNSVSAIINGNNALVGAYPWMVALISPATPAATTLAQRQFCGGSLIAPQWVLTAAHCVETRQADKFQVTIGLSDLSGISGELRDVSEIIINPRYDNVKLVNDVALLRLATPASAMPVALPPASAAGSLGSVAATALGWGTSTGVKYPDCIVAFPAGIPYNQTDFSCGSIAFQRQGLVSQLQSGQLAVLTNAACYQAYLGFLTLHKYDIPPDLNAGNVVKPGTLCVQDPAIHVSACYGDSGGPLVASVAGKTVIVGVTSYGIEDRCLGTYGLNFFTEVAYFLDFINQSMASTKELDFSQLCAGAITPVLDLAPVVAGQAKATLSWKAAANAVGYTLQYVPIPRQGLAVGRLNLAAAATELSITLPTGAHYMVAVQAKGRDCDGAVSDPIELSVP